MECTELNGKIKISPVRDLDLAQTLDCGQSFRWIQQSDGSFKGVAYGKSVTVRLENEDMYIENADKADFENIWYNYFDFMLDYGKIREEISASHPVLREAARYAPGIRILRQEPYEALCTFIISQNNNIKRIKGIVQRLCENFGEKLSDGEFAFPTAEKMSKLTPDDLAPLRAGFRSRYLVDAAQKVYSGEVNLEKCRTCNYEQARGDLMKITGVGVKVADCTLLFGLHRIEAFPVDVWMKRVLQYYPDGLPECFSGYEGIAQQYLFHWARNNLQAVK